MERLKFVAMFWPMFLRTRVAAVFRLIYCANDLLSDFMGRLITEDRKDGNENSMLGVYSSSLNKTFN